MKYQITNLKCSCLAHGIDLIMLEALGVSKGVKSLLVAHQNIMQ